LRQCCRERILDWTDDRVAKRWVDDARSANSLPRELTKLGGAKVILATVTSGMAMSAVIGGLGVDGKLIVLGDRMMSGKARFRVVLTTGR
jgi:hypothetical protein